MYLSLDRSAWLQLWLTVCLCGCDTPAPIMRVPFDREVPLEFNRDGIDGRLGDIGRQVMIIRDVSEWRSFWGEHQLPVPEVDFIDRCVVAVFGGQRASAGYSVEILGISFDRDQRKLVVEVRENEPPRSAGTLTVLSFPFDLVVFDKPGDWDVVELRGFEV